MLTFIAALRVFDLVFVLTRGGPGQETKVVSMLIYEEAFEYHHAGYGAAMALVMTVLIVTRVGRRVLPAIAAGGETQCALAWAKN